MLVESAESVNAHTRTHFIRQRNPLIHAAHIWVCRRVRRALMAPDYDFVKLGQHRQPARVQTLPLCFLFSRCGVHVDNLFGRARVVGTGLFAGRVAAHTDNAAVVGRQLDGLAVQFAAAKVCRVCAVCRLAVDNSIRTKSCRPTRLGWPPKVVCLADRPAVVDAAGQEVWCSLCGLCCGGVGRDLEDWLCHGVE